MIDATLRALLAPYVDYPLRAFLERSGASRWLVSCWLILGLPGLFSSARAQSLDWSPPQIASSAERLLMEQIQDLRQADQPQEALSSLQKLFDQGSQSLVEADGVRHKGTLKTQRFIPLREWCISEIASILAEHHAERELYLEQTDSAARMALTNLQQSKDLEETARAALRYRLSHYGDQFLLLLTDLYLERGWPIRAMHALEQLSDSQLRHRLAEGEAPAATAVEAVNLPWWYIWQASGDALAVRDRWTAEWAKSRRQTATATSIRQFDTDITFDDLVTRLLLANALDPQAMPKEAVAAWLKGIKPTLTEAEQAELSTAVAMSSEFEAETQAAWQTFAGIASRSPESEGKFDLSVWPEWHHQLERYSASSDRTTASQPRVGERERGTLPYHPVVVDGRVYVNELNRIRAYDLRSGKVWPEGSSTFTLFDSQISSAAYIPLGYPLVGAPRGTLSVADGCLYARMGSPVTGWANREAAEDGGSLSYLVGMDLRRQGSLLRGFPLRLIPPAFSGAEFEGAPLLWGSLLLVAIVERDNVGIRRSVAAFDRLSGELRWRSPVLAAGVVEGSDRANLITHQLLTMAGGRLYYSTDLGVIACLDPLNGQVDWLQRYQRIQDVKQTFPHPDRFKYRDLSPCMVANGLVYCLPRDCPEMFALDATSGELIWATDDACVADAIHMLGVCGESLIVSGDRLVWLDRLSGRVQLAYPGATTPGTINALPSPRGLGRGVISGSEVYWPVAGEVFVFAGDMSDRSVSQPVAIRRRYRVTSGGSEGGNLTIASGHLIYCSPSRIMAFAE